MIWRMITMLAVKVALAISSVSIASAQLNIPDMDKVELMFADDALLADATQDIRHMERHELDMLTDALATCAATGRHPDDAVEAHCKISRQRFFFAYESDRALDRLMAMLAGKIGQIRRGMANSDDRFRRALDSTFRLNAIQRQLAKAIAARNRSLAKGN